MDSISGRTADFGRISLAVIRMVNGALGLFLPHKLITRIDPAEPPSPAAVYAFRLFGVRTILIGRDLLVAGEARAKAVDEAPWIHASDTLTATLLTLGRRVPGRLGTPLIAISGLNTLLAVLAKRGSRP